MKTKAKIAHEKPSLDCIEQWLVHLLARTLKIDDKDIDRDKPFYSYGLDSLHLQGLFAEIEQKFAINFNESSILDQDTIGTCTQLIHDNIPEDSPVVPKKLESVPKIDPAEYQQYTDFTRYPPYENLKKMQSELVNIFFDQQEGVAGDTCIIKGQKVVNFTSYNYLGLTANPMVKKIATQAMEQYGTSVSASRIVSGQKLIHQELESEIAQFIGTEDAIVFTTGHATNVNTISHLFGADDLILHDELAHNSLIQGALFSGATRMTFPHNDWLSVDTILKKHRHAYKRVLVIIEGIYSMDGDIPDVINFIKVKDAHHAWLMIDEAHSIGVLGKTGGGIREHFNLDPYAVDIWMGTLSKAFASCGGYVAGRKELVEYLKYTCPGFVYSVGITPANAGAALAAMRVLKKEPERIVQLNKMACLAREVALSYQFNIGLNNYTPVLPIIIGDSKKSIFLAQKLLEKNINIKPIIYPAVPEHLARLRVFITALNKPYQIEKSFRVLAEMMR